MPARSSLIQLTIKNIVLIEALSLEWHDGLNVLTGETGAGKSILLDSLGLALGARSEARLVRHGADQGTVIAEFDLAADHPVWSLLSENDLEAEEGTLVVRRRLGADGRSRAYINDQSVSVSLLRQVGALLVEIHGQHDAHGLMDPKTHLGLLDAYAQTAPLLTDVQSTWSALRTARKAYAAAEAEVMAAREEEDYLRYMVAELSDLAPEPGEEEALALERIDLMQSEKLAESLEAADKALVGDDGAASGLRAAERALSRLADKAGPRMEPILAQAEKAAIELDELINLVTDVARDLEINPGRLEKVEERLFALKAAARKHKVEVDALPALAASFEARLADVEQGDQRLQDLKVAVTNAEARYTTAAETLSHARRAAAEILDRAIEAELAPLKMDRARFETRFEAADTASWGPHGWDMVEFCIAANPGSPVGPLARVASGGELSRVTLALKVVLATGGVIGTMVFDEVDAGVGGATAAAVGERLSRLSDEGAQVLVVTHSPQVAARGAAHWRIAKDQGDDQTQTHVRVLSDEERQDEVARMLSGAEVTDAAKAAARDLLV